jgi:hypothetical protein
MDYSGGYGRRVLYSDIWDSYNSGHLSYWYTKAITPRLNFTFRLDSQVNDFETYFLSPSGASLATSAANAAAANTQTGAPPPAVTDLINSGLAQNSPAQTALYGGRVLMTTVSTTLSFAKTTRLSYHLGFSAVRTENLGSNSTATPGQNLNSTPGLLEHGTFGNVSAGLGYLVTSRTSIGANVIVSRSFSAIGDYYYTEPQFNVTHTFSPWWYAGAYVGLGFNDPVRQTLPVAQTRRATGGVSTTFAGSSQAVTLSAAATGEDIYALGAGRTLAATATWGLHPFRSRWSFFSYASVYSTGGSGGGSLSSWIASAGANRVLTDHLFWGMSANYSDYQGQLLNNLAAATGTPLSSAFNNQAYRGVQMSLTWVPGVLRW